ncbi:MAG: PAS domain S-box protein [Heteroscytonema crispum UTEX LB 1556]
MLELLQNFFSSNSFIPDGHCYLWKPGLVWLHVISDALIALAYYSIPITLLYFVQKRKDLPFNWIFLLFGAFIVACGTTHLMEVWTLWHPIYWLSGTLKAITAAVSVYTAVILVQLIPEALTLPSPAQLEAANQELQQQINVSEASRKARQQAEEALQESERRFRAIFNQTFQFIGLLQPDGTLLEINQTALNFGGLNYADVIGQPFWDTWWWRISEATQNRLKSAIAKAASGQFIRYEVDVWGVENIVTTIDFSLKPVFDETGKVVLLISEGRDITDRKEAEAALRKAHNLLEIRVQERTADLATANAALQAEIAERKRVEAALREITTLERAILDSANYTIISTTPDGTILTFNAAAERYLGYTAAEVVGKTTPVIIHNRDEVVQRAQELSQELGVPMEPGFEVFVAKTRRGEVDEREWSYIRKDGSHFPVLLSITALRDAENNITGFLGIGSDISERKRAEEALRESEERFHQAFEYAAIGMALVSLEGRWLQVNRSLCEMIGYGEEELLVTTFQAITHPEDLEIDLVYMQQLMAGEISTYQMEKRYLHKLTQVVWALLSVSLVRDAQGQPLYFVAQVENISDRKQVESALRENEQLLRTVLENLPLGVWITDKNGQLLLGNPAGQQIWAGIRYVGVGQHHEYKGWWADTLQPIEPSQWAVVRAITRGETSLNEVIKIRCFDGSYKTILNSALPIRDAQQNITGAIVVNQDITGLKRTEEELRRQNLRSQLFAEVTLKIRQSLQIEEILQTTVTEVQRILQADRVLIFKLHPDGSGRVVQESVVAGWQVTLGQDIIDPCFQQLYLEKYRQGEITAVTDVEDGSILPCYVEFLQQFGVKANLVVPILVRENLWGLLIAHQCGNARQWTEFELTLLKHLADQIGIALSQAQLLEQEIRQRQELIRSQEELRHLSKALESAVEGISQLDTQGRYISVNPAYASITGYQPEELIGVDWQIIVYPEDLEKLLAAYHRMLVNGKVEVEARGVKKDGSVFDKQLVMVKACNPQQEFIGHYCFMKDISDRREVERLKDEFVSVVSHELRTPLTSISGALDLLASGILQNQPDDAQRMLNIAANNTDRLVRLINDILDIERIESGKVQMTKQICNAADLITESAEIMQEMAEQAGVTLSVSPISARIWADSDRIIQVLTNLLSNAIKFSPAGSTVWLSAELQEDEWERGGGGEGGDDLGDKEDGCEDKGDKEETSPLSPPSPPPPPPPPPPSPRQSAHSGEPPQRAGSPLLLPPSPDQSARPRKGHSG